MNSNSLPTPTSSEEIVYKGKLIEIVHRKMKAGDKEFTIELARRAPGTRLIIVKENKILLTKEYRMKLKEWDTRLPGGKVFDSLNEYNEFLKSGKDIKEAAKTAAKKEALEEVEIIANNLSFFAISPCGATIVWDLYYFVVTSFEESKKGQHLETGEYIKIEWVNFEDVKKMCLDGTIQEGRTSTILLRFLNSI